MSKYILKKDLPFAKAGRELAEFCDIIVCWETKGVLNNPPGVEATAHYIGKVKDLNRLIAEGWIEEVKEDKRKWWEKLDTEIPKKRIRELVERYPDEVQKEVMKHASKKMKEWYNEQKLKDESKKEEPKDQVGISILEIIRDAVYNARINRRVVDKVYLSPILYSSFRDELQTELCCCLPPTEYGDKFEGVYVERKIDEPYISFTYKEPKSDKKPGEFYIVSSPGKPNYAFVHYGQAFCEKCLRGGSDTVIIKVREVME